MQQFIGKGSRSDEEILKRHWQSADLTLGEDEAFGRDTVFLDEQASTRLWYLAEVPRNT